MTLIPLGSFVLLTLAWGAAFLFIFMLIPDEQQHAEEQEAISKGVSQEISPLILTLRPVFRALYPMVNWIRVPQYRKNIEKKFINAGMSGTMTTDEFLAYKVLMALFFVGMFGGILGRGIMRWDAPYSVDVIFLVTGSFFPDVWLSSSVAERQKKIRRAMPYVMDLLTLSVEAGLDFIAGISKVCEKATQSPLIDEFSYMLGEIQLGASRQQALRNLALRVDMQELRSFSAMLIQADILGASIGPVLRAQSELIRVKRFQNAEKQGAQATQKILFPLILCIMPAVFVVIIGPIALMYLYDPTPGIGQ